MGPRYLAFCSGGAVDADQFGRDLRAGAQRPHTDIAARQFLGDHAHGDLAHAQPAIGFGDGQAEDAQFGHLVNDLQRDQLVAHMPAMGMGGDLLVGKAMKLVGDHAVGFVQSAIAKITGPVPQGFGDGLTHGDAVTFGHQLAGGRAGEELTLIEAQITGAGDLVLAHGDAVFELLEIGPEATGQDQLFQIREPAVAVETLGPAEKLFERSHIGGHPGIAVQGELVLVEFGGVHRATGRGQRNGGLRGGRSERLRIGQGIAAKVEWVVHGATRQFWARSIFVMAGLVPAIHVIVSGSVAECADGRGCPQQVRA